MYLYGMFDDTYMTIDSPGKGVFRDRASKFVGITVAVRTEAEVKEALAAIRKEYWDANHHCFAWVLGADRSAFRFNDDGEPSGSAGRPIYGQILSKDLTNILVVVVRYFGGTKLGVSGLINAYRTASREAIDASRIVERVVTEVFEVKFDYSRMNDVMKLLKDEKLEQSHHQFEQDCSLQFKVRRRDSDKIQQQFREIKGVEVKYLSTE
jgi:uncharacterized YigZ family protein